jgi:hypothetical protein
MTIKLKAISLALALLALSSAQAETRKQLELRMEQVLANAGPPVGSVVYHGTYSWEALGDHSLLLWETPQRAYFVDVQPICNEFPWENSIIVDFRNMTLDSKFDSILVRGQRCRIYEIRPVDVKALRAAQKQARKDDDDD